MSMSAPHACGPHYERLCSIAHTLDMWVEVTVGREKLGKGAQATHRNLAFLIVRSVHDTDRTFSHAEPLDGRDIEDAALELLKRLGWVRDSEIPA